MRALIAIALLAGCDRVLGLGDITPAAPSDAHGTGDGDALADAPSDGLPIRHPCLVDGFGAATIDPATWTKFSAASSPVPQVTERNGVAEVDILMQTPQQPLYNGLESVNAFPFDDATFEIKLAMPPTDPSAGIRLYVIADPSHEYYTTFAGNGITITLVNNTNIQTSSAFVVDPAMVHYMRLRIHGGILYVEAAAALGAWTTVAMEATAFATTMMSVGFAAGVELPGTTTVQQVDFDDALVTSTGC